MKVYSLYHFIIIYFHSDAKSAGDIQQRKRELEKQIEAVGGQLAGGKGPKKSAVTSKKGSKHILLS